MPTAPLFTGAVTSRKNGLQGSMGARRTRVLDRRARSDDGLGDVNPIFTLMALRASGCAPDATLAVAIANDARIVLRIERFMAFLSFVVARRATHIDRKAPAIRPSFVSDSSVAGPSQPLSSSISATISSTFSSTLRYMFTSTSKMTPPNSSTTIADHHNTHDQDQRDAIDETKAGIALDDEADQLLATRRFPHSDHHGDERHGIEVPLKAPAPRETVLEPLLERLEILIGVNTDWRIEPGDVWKLPPDDDQSHPGRTGDRPRVRHAKRAENGPQDRRPDHDRDLVDSLHALDPVDDMRRLPCVEVIDLRRHQRVRVQESFAPRRFYCLVHRVVS